MFEGCYTALATPMTGPQGLAVDYAALEALVEFQIDQGITGVLAMGTTGESPTLTWAEHAEVIVRINDFVRGRCAVIAGTGSNSTAECLEHTRHAAEAGVSTILLVDPYYNGPSSLEIRREYVAPVAREFPAQQFIPYVIPGRSGCQLMPEDLAVLHHELPNVNAVKEATGDQENQRRTRAVCGDDFDILSGDDPLTLAMMTDPAIRCSGTISVITNIAPAAVARMVSAALEGRRDEAEELAQALDPLAQCVTVKTQEETPYGARLVKARNPLPIKTLMRLLGMPVGVLRRPLGRMTPAGLDVLIDAARNVWERTPEILQPVADAFDVDIADRLTNPEYRNSLTY
jgi:4-hydroxy-tetrahydrodipicolinate synthase